MELKTSFKYPEWAKMPKNYDFETKNKNWSKYWTEFLLRTDAVWEKQKLLDYFRCFYKVFEFDKEENQFLMFYPRNANLAFWYPQDKSQEHVVFKGFTPTGMTDSFELSGTQQGKTDTSSMAGFGREDSYELCAYRFDLWYQCDQFYGSEKAKLAYDNKEYPCYKIFYEMQYACSDHMMDYLMELATFRKVNNINKDDLLNSDMQNFATIYDAEDQANRLKKTY